MDDSKITENIIEALNTSHKVVPPEGLLTRMEQMALAYSKKISSFSKQTVIGIAASFLLLISINIYVINKYNSVTSTSQMETSDDIYNLIPAKSVYHEQN